MTQFLTSEPAIAASVDLLAAALGREGGMLVTAESCTGGLIAAACTERPGSSAWFQRGWVTYSNEAKVECLGVDAALIARHGAVSEAVARAMAEGALRQAPGATQAVAVTGIAGPDGGSAAKPVGTVWIGWAGAAGATEAKGFRFEGSRGEVRQAAVRQALEGMLRRLETTQASDVRRS